MGGVAGCDVVRHPRGSGASGSLSPCQGRRLGPYRCRRQASSSLVKPKLPVEPAQPPLCHALTHPKSRPLSEKQSSSARGWACRCDSVLDFGVLERRARGRQLGVGVNRFSFRIAPKLLRWGFGACTKEHFNLRSYGHAPRSGRERAGRVSCFLTQFSCIRDVSAGVKGLRFIKGAAIFFE